MTTIYVVARALRKANPENVIGVEGRGKELWISIKDTDPATLKYPKGYSYIAKKSMICPANGESYKVVVYDH